MVDEIDTRCACGHAWMLHSSDGTCGWIGCHCGVSPVRKSVYHPRWADSNGKMTTYNAAATERGRRRARIAVERQFPGEPCYYCGEVAESVDHLTPRSRGGTSHPGNKVPACLWCNGMKGNMTYEEFIEHCRRITLHVAQKKRTREDTTK